jgi:hypothetical protein
LYKKVQFLGKVQKSLKKSATWQEKCGFADVERGPAQCTTPLPTTAGSCEMVVLWNVYPCII